MFVERCVELVLLSVKRASSTFGQKGLNEFVCRYVFVEVNAYIVSVYVSFCMFLGSMWDNICNYRYVLR